MKEMEIKNLTVDVKENTLLGDTKYIYRFETRSPVDLMELIKENKALKQKVEALDEELIDSYAAENQESGNCGKTEKSESWARALKKDKQREEYIELQKIFHDKKRCDFFRNIVLNSPCNLDEAIVFLKDSNNLERDAEIIIKYSKVGCGNQLNKVLSILNS